MKFVFSLWKVQSKRLQKTTRPLYHRAVTAFGAFKCHQYISEGHEHKVTHRRLYSLFSSSICEKGQERWGVPLMLHHLLTAT